LGESGIKQLLREADFYTHSFIRCRMRESRSRIRLGSGEKFIRLSRLRPAPDVDGLAALKNAMIADDVGQAYFGARAERRRTQKQ